MYKFSDYWKFGKDFLMSNYLNKPRLSVFMIYATSLCNSRCNTCNIWKKRPIEHLSFSAIKKALESKCIDKQTRIGFEGGEFILHPEVHEILSYVKENGYNFEILSNALLPEKLAEITVQYGIPRVYISLDGGRETYKKVRGVDGFDKVIKAIDLLKGKTEISLMYLINPWNDQSDLDFVIKLCKEKGLDLRVGVYNNMEFFDTTKKMHEIDYKVDTNVDVSEFAENQEFIDMFDDWKAGKIVLPCYSIRQELVVYPDGSVPICQNKQIILGNINESSLDEILNSERTRKLHAEHKYCNGCWINFHRKFEVALFRKLSFLPDFIIKMLLGDFKLPKR